MREKTVYATTRRGFLSQCITMPMGVWASLSSLQAWAAPTGSAPYKALVCVFLHGGNDAYNTVLATDSASWARYQATRNQQPESIALPRDKLHEISPQTPHVGREFALHPSLPGLAKLFNEAKRLAIVPNVGPLIQPTTKSQYLQGAVEKPAKLFSHNDQQSTWLTHGPEGTQTGWGGLLADKLSDGNQNALFSAISCISSTAWLEGSRIRPYQVAEQGSLRMGFQIDGNGRPHVYGSNQVAAILQTILNTPRTPHAMEADLCEINQRSTKAEALLSNALPPAQEAPYELGAATGNPLAQQLQIVARVIGARQTLGMSRQFFYVSLYGFDTHDRQNTRHAKLLRQLDEALVYFDQTLNGMGVGNSVTTFTASDFGRTFVSNGDGTDHGWGGHHFVMGGAVNGGEILGRFPAYGAKGRYDNEYADSPDMLSNGVLLPAISTQAYGAALGRWMGASSDQLIRAFPGLDRFPASSDLDRLFQA